MIIYIYITYHLLREPQTTIASRWEFVFSMKGSQVMIQSLTRDQSGHRHRNQFSQTYFVESPLENTSKRKKPPNNPFNFSAAFLKWMWKGTHHYHPLTSCLCDYGLHHSFAVWLTVELLENPWPDWLKEAVRYMKIFRSQLLWCNEMCWKYCHAYWLYIWVAFGGLCMIYVGKSFLHIVELPGGVKIYHSTLKYHELQILAFFIKKKQGSSFSKYQRFLEIWQASTFQPQAYKMDPEPVLNGVGS